ncbi:MAG: SMP-30/gluconolactonase/LRE family protein [Planctomycetota bacterium]
MVWSRFAALLVVVLTCGRAAAQNPAKSADGKKADVLAESFLFTEGPTCDAEGNIYFTDQPNDRIHKWSVDGKLTTFLEHAGRSNGLSFDKSGALWACADEKNELWKIDIATGKHTVVVKNFEGKLLNGPNDVWIHPSGGVYFTDPFYKRGYWKRGPEESPRSLLYLSPAGKLSRLDGDYKQPNGIVGTPDGKILYVADIGDSKIYAYDIQPDGGVANRRLFCSQGSDGMTIDDFGNVYLTRKGVMVFDKQGMKVAQIDVPVSATNVCFGGRDRQTLFITGGKGLYSLRMDVKGASPQ